jgi:hypothetical protein
MSDDPIRASKSVGILRLDHRLARSSLADAQMLKDNPDVFQVMKEQLILGSQDEAHMTGDILGGNWWRDTPPNRADILRAAYVKAIELANEPRPQGEPKPIITYHIRGLAADVFEVAVAATDREVHVLWLTPATPAPGSGLQARPPLEEQDLWMAASEQRVTTVRNRYLEMGYPDNEVPQPESIPGIDGVRIMRCPTY